MNTIGKIFVFALFIMSLVFMSFAVALYSTHTNWRDEIMRTREQIKAGQQLGYKAQLDQAKTDRNNLSAEITKLQAEVAASEAARDQVVAKIQTALEEKNKDLEVLRKEKEARELEREKAQAELAAARLELEAASKVVADLRSEVRTQQDKVDEQVDRAAKIASELHEK